MAVFPIALSMLPMQRPVPPPPVPSLSAPSQRVGKVVRAITHGLAGALLVSLFLHLLLIAGPAWRLPDLDTLLGRQGAFLDARLAPPDSSRQVEQVGAPHPARLPDAPSAGQARPVPAPVPTEPAIAAPVLPEAPPPQISEALLSAIPDIAQVLPRWGHIRFSVVRGEGGFEIGQALHEWKHDGHRYELTATTETTGIAALLRPAKTIQRSEGRLVHDDLVPAEFRNDRGNGDVQTAQFDWEHARVTLNGSEVVSVSGGAEDLLSMFYQLPQAAQRGTGFQMPVATGRKVERYAFEWLEEEDVKLPSGNFRCWHVRVRAASGGADTTEVWLAQSLAGLPVKIRHTDRKGGLFDQIAMDIDFEGRR